jgi:hypothetical protein
MRLLKLVESYVITEGRKEEVQKKYTQYFISLDIDPEEVIMLFSSHDPSGNNKYLDWMTKEYLALASKTTSNNTEDENKIINAVTIFHEKSQKLTSEYLNQKGFPKRVVDNPKDINSYNIRDLNILAGMLKREGDAKKENRSDAVVIYEDDKWLLLSPKSYEASCKYGAGTKWCIASKKNSSHYGSYSQRGRLIFVMDKTQADFTPGLPYNDNPLYKVAIFRENSGSITIWNAPDTQIGTNLNNFFSPKLVSIINNFFQNPAEAEARTTIREEKLKIATYFEEDAHRIGNWESAWVFDGGYVAFRALHLPEYRVRVTPFYNDEQIVQFYLDGVTTADQINWTRPYVAGDPEPFIEYRTLAIINDVIENDIEPVIRKDYVNEKIVHNLTIGAWDFDEEMSDYNNVLFYTAKNPTLSSYYWDKYRITLSVNLNSGKTQLVCVFTKDNRKTIIERPEFTTDLNFANLNVGVEQMLTTIKSTVAQFLEKTTKK